MLTFCKIEDSAERVDYLFCCILQCRSTERCVWFFSDELSSRIWYFNNQQNDTSASKVTREQLKQLTTDH
jgi:hypothetical protein